MRKIADSTVRRLSLYLRFLEEFEGQGIETVSSGALAGRGGTTSAQVRKDLSFFGSFGKRGLGYSVPELVDSLRQILGLTRHYRVALVGAGKIGSALVQNRGFRRRGFDFVAIFDRDPAKIGQAARRRAGGGRRPPRVGARQVPAGYRGPGHAAGVGTGGGGPAGRASGSSRSSTSRRCSSPCRADVTVKTVNLALELEALAYHLANPN